MKGIIECVEFMVKNPNVKIKSINHEINNSSVCAYYNDHHKTFHAAFEGYEWHTVVCFNIFQCGTWEAVKN